MSNKVSKDAKYYLARTRALTGLKAQIETIKALKPDTARKSIIVRDRLITNYWNDFQRSLVDIEATCNGTIRDAEAFYIANLAIEDEYYNAKLQIAELAGEEESTDPNKSIDMTFLHLPLVHEKR